MGGFSVLPLRWLMNILFIIAFVLCWFISGLPGLSMIMKALKFD